MFRLPCEDGASRVFECWDAVRPDVTEREIPKILRGLEPTRTVSARVDHPERRRQQLGDVPEQFVKCEQVLTVSKERLSATRIGSLDEAEMREVDAALLLSLALHR